MKTPIKTITLNPQTRIHAIETGRVAVRTNFKHKKGPGFLSKLNILLDKTFTEFLPIYVYVIEHPEGIIVIDTGENARVKEPDYFNDAGWLGKTFNTKHLKFEIERSDEIGPQLAELGIHPDQVRWVILTHLHLDHTDGLHYFPNNEILVSRIEMEKPASHTPYLYPSWFRPTQFEFNTETELPFGKVHYLTQAQDVALVHLPGHTWGHTGVLFHYEGRDFLFAGDTTYDLAQLQNRGLAAAHVSYRQAAGTVDKVLQFMENEQVIYLASHDGGVGDQFGKLALRQA